jgi:hypothetical protein
MAAADARGPAAAAAPRARAAAARAARVNPAPPGTARA